MLIDCTSCGSKIRVPDGMAGKKGKCPKCALVFTIPEADAPPGLAPLEIPAAPAPTSRADLGITAVPGERSAVPAAPPAAEQPAPASPRPAWEDDDNDRERGRSRRRDRYDDDDDDYGDVRRRLRRAPETNGLALAAMIVGIVSASLGVFAFCCWVLIAPLAGIGGAVAVILGFLGKAQGGESHAITGIVLGFVAVGLSLLWIFCGMSGLAFNLLAR